MARASSEAFVRLWQSSASATEVARALGVSLGAVTGRARRLRKLGVPLKKFIGSRYSRQDVDNLRKIAEEVSNGQAEV